MRSELWPFRPAPFADELLTSWIARLAHGHGLRPACFLEIIQPACSDFAALDWTSDPELLAVFAMRTDVPRPVIESLVLRFNPDPNLRHLLHHNWRGLPCNTVPLAWRRVCRTFGGAGVWRVSGCAPNTKRGCAIRARIAGVCYGSRTSRRQPAASAPARTAGNTLGVSPPERGAILESALLRKLIDVQQRIARHLT
jgi:hypothetical protein